jgi:hypothetical protein
VGAIVVRFDEIPERVEVAVGQSPGITAN